MEDRSSTAAKSNYDEHLRREMERTDAKLRHFRGVAAGVMQDAQKLLKEIQESCQDQRTCEEILEGVEAPITPVPICGWQEFREKLHLLEHYLDYARRLCEGSLEKSPTEESEVGR